MKLAGEHGCKFFEVSAKTGWGILAMLHELQSLLLGSFGQAATEELVSWFSWVETRDQNVRSCWDLMTLPFVIASKRAANFAQSSE